MTSCVHHWVLPDGGSGRRGDGCCKKCGVSREFSLVDEDLPRWNDKAGTVRGAAASSAARRRAKARKREAMV